MEESGNASAPQPNLQQKLWELVDREFRGARRYRLDEVLQTAEANGINVTWEDLRRISGLWSGEPAVTPTFVTDFLSAYSLDLNPSSALDPWAGIGSTLIPIVKKGGISEATGIVLRTDELAVAQRMAAELQVKWISGRAASVLPSLSDFDLVVSSPPFGLQSR